jgi:pilus assembly protein CpaE
VTQAASLKTCLIAADEGLAVEVREALRSPGVQLLFERPGTIGIEELQAALLRLRPDVLVLDARLSSLAQASSGMSGAPDIVAVYGKADAEMILAAMRAGIKEFVYSPLGQSLPESLERIRQSRADSAGCAGRMIVVAGASGGCGATTVACHAAAELARSNGDRVLLADLDCDGGAIGFLMNSKSPYNLADAVANTDRLDPSYWEALVSNGYPNLEVIQGPPVTLSRTPLPETQVCEVLRFMRFQYSWTVVDSGKAGSPAVWSSLEPSDYAFLVSTVDLVALHRARQVVRALDASGITPDRVKLILNAVPKSPLVTPQEIESTLGLELYAVLGSDGEAIGEAQSNRKLAGNSTTFGRQIARMVAKLSGNVNAIPKRRFSLFS